MPKIFLLRERLRKFKLRSSDIEIDQTECNRSELLAYDVIALERGAFLRIPPEQSLILLAEIENDRFKQLLTITKDERGHTLEVRCSLWVISDQKPMSAACLLYSQERTLGRQINDWV